MLILGLIFFVLLVVIHEYGHFLVAKKNGVEVDEFGIGFPPKIAGKELGKGIFKAYYTINLLPLGGFVRLRGENDSATGEGTFGSKSFKTKTKILLAGVAANLFAAFLIFTILAAVGMPKLIDNQYSFGTEKQISDKVTVGFVAEQSPAEQAGIEVGDNILSFDQQTILNSKQISNISEDNAGKEVEIVYESDEEQITKNIQLNETSEEGFLGVQPLDNERFTYGLASPIVGAGVTTQLSMLTLEGVIGLFADLFVGNFSEASEDVAGPIGIFSILSNIGVFGLAFFFYFIAVISLTLGVMNALPIPALDGGRVFVSGLFKLLKKPLSKDLEQRIHGTGFLLLMVLIVLISWVDIGRL